MDRLEWQIRKCFKLEEEIKEYKEVILRLKETLSHYGKIKAGWFEHLDLMAYHDDGEMARKALDECFPGGWR